MELNSDNIKRFINISRYYIEKNWHVLTIRFIAYAYLFGAFCFMALYYSYNIRIAVKPLSYFIISLITLCVYLLYIMINHLFVRFVVTHKILLIFDLLAFMMLLCISVGDGWVEN